MAVSAFPGKILVTRIIFFLIFYMSPNLAPKPTDQSHSNSIFSIFRVLLQVSLTIPFHFRPTLNVKDSSHKKQETWNFTKMINCFCCYVIKSARETTKKVLLSVIWNLLLIKINLSQIRTLEIKREKVCAVCPYLLFLCK